MSDLTTEALDRLTQLDGDPTNGCEDYYCVNPFHEHDENGWPALPNYWASGGPDDDQLLAVIAERDAARALVAALRERVEALADSIHGDAGWEHNGGCEGEPDCLACIEAELRTALADPATAKEADE